jgi:hypothetical protein
MIGSLQQFMDGKKRRRKRSRIEHKEASKNDFQVCRSGFLATAVKVSKVWRGS